jgi:hypothetical protein
MGAGPERESGGTAIVGLCWILILRHARHTRPCIGSGGPVWVIFNGMTGLRTYELQISHDFTPIGFNPFIIGFAIEPRRRCFTSGGRGVSSLVE